MDLIPKPDQVVSAASNVAHKVLYGGLADLRPMPRTLIDDGALREVYHYRPGGDVRETGDPVLLVTPLAAPAICFDLRRGCSLVEHFVTQGRPTYLVEYGEVSFKNRNLGMEHWIDEVVPRRSARSPSTPAGARCTSSAGASAASSPLLAAADPPTCRSRRSPSSARRSTSAWCRWWRRCARCSTSPRAGAWSPAAYQAHGRRPKPLVQWAFQLSSVQKLITKPIAVAHPPRRHRVPRPDRGRRPVHRPT